MIANLEEDEARTMDSQIVIGLVAIAMAVIMAGISITRNGDAYEYLSSIFIAEWGAMFVVSRMAAPGAPRIGVSVFFVLAMAWSAVMWWKLRRDYKRRRDLRQSG